MIQDRRRSNTEFSKEIAELLRELKIYENETKEWEKRILSILVEHGTVKKVDTKQREEEHEFLREWIKKSKEDAEIRKAVKIRLYQTTTGLGVTALLAGAWYLFVDQLKHILMGG